MMVKKLEFRRQESSHFSTNNENIMIKSPKTSLGPEPVPSPVRIPSHLRSNNRPVSPLTQNESMFGTVPPRETFEKSSNGIMICDYDHSVTELYEMLESSDWEKACSRCRTHPEDVRTWVSRRDTNGSIRWKLLPLHAAVIFQAPLPVIEVLLNEHPISAAKRDDQGMLPIHLAFRHKADESVIEKLLMQYPSGVIIKDQRGKVPLNHGKEMFFSSKIMTLYAETFNKCQHCENETVAKEAEIRITYDNRVTALTNAYEARIAALVKSHEEIVERVKVEAEQAAKNANAHQSKEIDQLRNLLSIEESSRRKASELETDLVALNSSLVEEKRKREELQKVVQDEKNKRSDLIDNVHQILIDQKSLHDHCEKQQEKLAQAQKLREQLLRTLLQKDDGKAIQVSNEICLLSSNIVASTENILGVPQGSLTRNDLAPNTGNSLVDDGTPCNQVATAAATNNGGDLLADTNTNHGDDISAITESSYIQPFGDS